VNFGEGAVKSGLRGICFVPQQSGPGRITTGAEHPSACKHYDLNVIMRMLGPLGTRDADAATGERIIRLQAANLVLGRSFQARLRRHVPEANIKWKRHLNLVEQFPSQILYIFMTR
jgi:hypothetical protein